MKVYIVEDYKGLLSVYDNLGDALRAIRDIIVEQCSYSDLNDMAAMREDVLREYNSVISSFNEDGFYVDNGPCLYIKDMKLTKERRS